jgi:hypothetical protein
MPQTNLFVNVNASSVENALVRSVNDATPVPFPEIALGDNRAYNLYFVDGLGNYAPFSGSAGYIPYVGIGPFGQPSGGTFTLTFGGYTTAALAWNISPASLQTALQGLTSIGSGNCTVTGVAGQYYIVTFVGSLGGQPIAAITANPANLTPTSNIDVATITAGSSAPATNAVQSIAPSVNPWIFTDTWTPISNGWTGYLAANAVNLLEAFFASTTVNINGAPTLNGLLQIAVQDPSSNFLSYLQTPATVLDSILNLHTFASAQAPTFVTAAQLAAAVLGLNNFTRQDLATSTPGTTNITPQSTSRNHTGEINFSGAAIGTYNVVVQTTNSPQYGDQVLLRLYGLAALPSGMIINVYSGTTSGSLIQTITLDGSQRAQHFVLVGYNTTGSAWALTFSTATLMDPTQNLVGLSSTLSSKLNLKSLFANIQSKSTAYAVLAADEGSLFKCNAVGGPFAMTLPAASVGSGFLVALLKTDTTANAVTTSPATASMTTPGQLLVLESDGSNWNVLINVAPPASTSSAELPVWSLPNITALTGGLSTTLDGIPTAAGATLPGQIVEIYYSGGLIVRYRGRAGADVAQAMFLVRPVDFNAVSNQFVWELLSVTKQAWPCTYNATQGGFQQIVATGAIGASSLSLGVAFTFA